MLRASSFGFREIFSERHVNNIYYDTPLFRFFSENVQGVPERKKIRIRWYGEAHLPNRCRFEIKRKNGLVGAKDVEQVDCSFDNLNDMPGIENVRVPDIFAHETASVGPTLLNRYRRRYFLSASEQFRATIDYDIFYSHPSAANKNGMGYPDNEAVLELKYDHEFDMDASGVSSELPFSVSKKSKYVTGINMVYGF
nr:VTC domain-containing protein [Pseudodesulfovibrio sp. S3-i]